MTNTLFRALTAVLCMTLNACGGKAVDMGGAWDTDGGVDGEGGAPGGNAAASDADAAADVMPAGCNLPGPDKGEVLIRVGNLVTSTQVFDFCFQKPNSTAFGSPLFASSGTDCPKGLAYRQMLVPFWVPGGDTLVKVIAYGDSCDGQGLVTGDLSPKTSGIKTVLLLGDGKSAPTLMTGAESVASTASSFKLRFVHAAPHLAPLDFGLAQVNPSAAIYAPFGRNYVFGSAVPGVAVDIAHMDGFGYVEPQLPPGVVPFGVGPFDYDQPPNASIPATFTAELKFRPGSSYTMFMIGKSDQDPDYPHQLWACHESPSEADGVFSLCSDNAMY